MTDNESSAASPSDAQQHPPGSLGWKILVASAAFRFFGLIHEHEICEVIGQPDQAGKAGAWPVAYFSEYLQARGLAGGGLRAMLRILWQWKRPDSYCAPGGIRGCTACPCKVSSTLRRG